MATSSYKDYQVRAKTREVVSYHYDDKLPGKPLHLLIPGGIVALAALAAVVHTAYRTWYLKELPENAGILWMCAFAPFYIGAVYVFSYGYELYDHKKALRLTAIIVVVTVLAVAILAAILAALSSAKSERSSSRSRSKSRSSSPGVNISLGGLIPNIDRTTHTHTETGLPPAAAAGGAAVPVAIQCAFCGFNFVPEHTQTVCPGCKAPAPRTTPQPPQDSAA